MFLVTWLRVHIKSSNEFRHACLLAHQPHSSIAPSLPTDRHDCKEQTRAAGQAFPK